MLCCGGGGGESVTDTEEKEKFRVLETRWIVQKEAIGEGGFGTVHLCRDKRSGKGRACKAMRLPTSLDREDFRHEVNILKMIRTHKNICHIVDSAEDSRYGYLVMQSCSGGELFDRIAARKCTEKDAAMAVLDVLSALDFIHSRRILHRDLKPENLLYKDKAPSSPLKLIDFGLAIRIQPNEKATEVCGTTSYMAPEVLQGSYGVECDIWSLGVITYFMLSGTLPFPGKNDDEKEARILKGSYPTEGRHWNHVSKEGIDFVRSLLVASPKKRLTCQKAKQHPWIMNRAALSDKPLSEDVAQSLKRYADAHRFEKAIRHQMATNLTSTELHRLRNVFEKLDADGTGTVSVDVLKKVLQDDAADAKTAETLAKLDIAAFDLDGDGQIDWQEFVAGAMEDHEVYNEDNLEKVFAKLDVNGDGTLCQREVAGILGDDHEFSRELLEQIRAARGSEGNLKELTMSLDEFKKVMTKGAPTKEAAAATRGRRRHHHGPVGGVAAPPDKV